MNVRLLYSQLCGPSAKVTDPEVHCLFIFCFCSGLSMCLTWEDRWLSNDRTSLLIYMTMCKIFTKSKRTNKEVSCVLWHRTVDGGRSFKGYATIWQASRLWKFFFSFFKLCNILRLRSIKDSRSKRVIYGFMISSSLYIYIFFFPVPICHCQRKRMIVVFRLCRMSRQNLERKILSSVINSIPCHSNVFNCNV